MEQRRTRHVLLTSFAKIFIRKGIKLGEPFCCHPYVWDDAKGYPELTTSLLRLLGWVFNFVLSISYFRLYLIQVVFKKTPGGKPALTDEFPVSIAIFDLLPVMIHVAITMIQGYMTFHARNYLVYCLELEGKACYDSQYQV